MRFRLLVAALVNLALVGGAYGMLIDGAGTVTDWGVTPFSRPNFSDAAYGILWSTIADDYAPIAYPGVGRQPSPGLSSGGEVFDLEEMHLRFADDRLQVLVTTSSPGAATVGGSTYWLGDLFIEIDGQDFAVVTQNVTQGLAAGAVYRLNGDADVVALQSAPRSYAMSTAVVANDYGPPATVAEIAGPWAVRSTIDPDQLLGTAALSTATFDYGGAEDGTYLIEYTIDPALLGLVGPGPVTAHITWGCGNDVIRVAGSGPIIVPEPGTLGLAAVAAALAYLSQRRARKPA